MTRHIAIFLLILSFHCMLAQPGSKNSENTSLDPSAVPQAAVHSFTTENPGVSVTWRADSKNFRASFIDPLTKMGRVIVYDAEGKVVRRDNEVDQQTYPGLIREFYTKNYPGEVYQVWKSENTNDGQALYFSSRHEETFWFDTQGNVVPEKRAEKKKKDK